MEIKDRLRDCYRLEIKESGRLMVGGVRSWISVFKKGTRGIAGKFEEGVRVRW